MKGEDGLVSLPTGSEKRIMRGERTFNIEISKILVREGCELKIKRKL